MSRFSLIVMFALILAITPVSCGTETSIAQVRDKTITESDLQNAIDELILQNRNELFPEPDTPAYAEIEKRVLQRLVDDEVIRFEAGRMNIAVSEKEIQQRIDQEKLSSGSETQFIQNLSEQGMTVDQFAHNIRNSMLFEKVFSQTTKDVPEATDEDAFQYYEQAASAKDPISAVSFDKAKARIKAKLDQESKTAAFQHWLEDARDRNEIVIDEKYR